METKSGLNPVLAYVFGFFTVIVIFLIIYLFALYFPNFRSVYLNLFANFPEEDDT